MNRWLPALGTLGMVLLGLAVGTGSTAVDDRFLRDTHNLFGANPSWMLFFSSWWLLAPVLVASVLVAMLRRDWVLAALVGLFTWVSLLINEGLKHLFNRRNGSYLEYPSGHTTLVVAVMASLVVVIGVRAWSVALAVTVCVLGMIGLIACGYHYFTDTIGAVLLTTAEMSMARALTARQRILEPHTSGT